MPLYEYAHGDHFFIRFVPLRDHSPVAVCDCGEMAQQVIGAPATVKVCEDVHYTSPIDGTPITSWAARRNDLAKHRCVPYDPEMKKDYERRGKEKEAQFEKAVEATIEQQIEKMPTAKRGKLYNELTRASAEAVVERGTWTK